MDIQWLKDKISKGEYEFRKHALERGILRGINPLEVKEAILQGEIIELKSIQTIPAATVV